MFFRSKKENGKDTQPSSAVAAKPGKAAATTLPMPVKSSGTKSATLAAVPAPARPGKALTTAPALAAAKPLAPEALKQRADASRRLAATLGGIVGLMLRSPRHRDRKLSDLRWLVLPAIRTGQFALVTAQSKAHGHSAPIAAVLWASVSAEVDKRLSENLSAPMRLGPREWKSGDILWLVEAVGNERAVSALVRQLQARDWKGKAAKARVKDSKGEVKVRLFEAQAAAHGAAGRTH